MAHDVLGPIVVADLGAEDAAEAGDGAGRREDGAFSTFVGCKPRGKVGLDLYETGPTRGPGVRSWPDLDVAGRAPDIFPRQLRELVGPESGEKADREVRDEQVQVLVFAVFGMAQKGLGLFDGENWHLAGAANARLHSLQGIERRRNVFVLLGEVEDGAEHPVPALPGVAAESHPGEPAGHLVGERQFVHPAVAEGGAEADLELGPDLFERISTARAAALGVCVAELRDEILHPDRRLGRAVLQPEGGSLLQRGATLEELRRAHGVHAQFVAQEDGAASLEVALIRLLGDEPKRVLFRPEEIALPATVDRIRDLPRQLAMLGGTLGTLPGLRPEVRVAPALESAVLGVEESLGRRRHPKKSGTKVAPVNK